VALAAVEVAERMFAISRAETHTGADYYIAPVGSSVDDLESSFRLEISGVDRGDTSIVRRRLRAKLKQAKVGNSNLPALAAVVGFRELLILIEKADLP
jgi:hypothetical protein